MARGSAAAKVWVSLAVAGLMTVGPANSFAQQTKAATLPDAQVESNVLKALAGVPELADQAIGTTTVYGEVTITGSVRDEASREKAEKAVATTPGVKKVIDELVVGGPAPSVANDAPAEQQAQMTPQPAEPQSADPQAQDTGPDPAERNTANPDGSRTQGQVAQSQPAPAAPVERPQTQQAPYPQQGPSAYPAYRQPRTYRLQQAGQAMTLPVGTYLRVRVNQGMDSRHTQSGTMFTGVVLNDVVLGGMVAVPRGAEVQGQVVDVHPGGDMRGRGGLALQLAQINLEGHSYPIATDPWMQQGYDKTGQTVGNTVGFGAMGAMIGAIAGGGPGALLGAGIGSVAGLGLSSASHNGEAAMPAEAILNFRLSQQAAINTVSQAELERLEATMPPVNDVQQPQLRRRTYPYPYAPVAYPYGYPAPYPYPYPYYR